MNEENKFLFIGGMHRSGTSAIYNLFGGDPRISTFVNTGVTENEGQFLQSVYPIDKYYGGVGTFALHPEIHLTEASPLITVARDNLFNHWEPYWDLSKIILAEKTPSNLIRSRFLQEVFPRSMFLFVMRHPIASAMATAKWTGAYMTTLIENWLTAHEILTNDMKHLEHAEILRYEDFTVAPQSFEKVFKDLLGFTPQVNWNSIRAGLNTKYIIRYKKGDFHLNVSGWKRPMKQVRNILETYNIQRKFEERANRFGYSFTDPYLLPAVRKSS